MDKTPTEWMNEAITLSKETVLDIPVGCIITRGNQELSRGTNEREKKQDPVGHAEIIAIQKAAKSLESWRLDGCVIYTTLEPCPMCAEAIIQTRISKIFFGAYDLKSGACGSAFNLFKKGRIYPVVEIIGGMEEDACQNILKTYFEKNVRSKK